MKRKFILFAALVGAMIATSAMAADTDVTSTYLTNADCSSTTGWTVTAPTYSSSGSNSSSLNSSYYGTTTLSEFNSGSTCFFTKIPGGNQTSSTRTYSSANVFLQSVTLPAGTYTISCKAYGLIYSSNSSNYYVKLNSSSGNTATAATAFYMIAGTTTSSTVAFTSDCANSGGATLSTEITLDEAATVYIGAGVNKLYVKGSSSNVYATMYVDDFTITQADTSATKVEWTATDSFSNLDFTECTFSSSNSYADDMPNWSVDYSTCVNTICVIKSATNQSWYCANFTNTYGFKADVYSTSVSAGRVIWQSAFVPAGTYTVSATGFFVYNSSSNKPAFYLYANDQQATFAQVANAQTPTTTTITCSVTLDTPGILEVGIGCPDITVSSPSTWVGGLYTDGGITITGPTTTYYDDQTYTYWDTAGSLIGAENLDFEDGVTNYVPDSWTVNYNYTSGSCSTATDDYASSLTESNMFKYGVDSSGTLNAGTILSQTISNVPAGTYVVTAVAHSEADGFYLFANDNTTAIPAVLTTYSSSWALAHQVSVAVSLDTTGDLEIGLKTTSSISGGDNGVNIYLDNIVIYAEQGDIIVPSVEGWGTFYSTVAYAMPSELTGYIVTGVSGDLLTLEAAYEAGDIVPANTALMVYSGDTYEEDDFDSEEGGYPTSYFIVTSASGTEASTNLLYGSACEVETNVNGETDGYSFYKLSYDSNGENIGFYYGAEDGAAFTSAAGKCWLALTAAQTSAGIRGYAIANGGDDTTGITIAPAATSSNAIYNLAGQRVNNTAKGLYIINGKKIVK